MGRGRDVHFKLMLCIEIMLAEYVEIGVQCRSRVRIAGKIKAQRRDFRRTQVLATRRSAQPVAGQFFGQQTENRQSIEIRTFSENLPGFSPGRIQQDEERAFITVDINAIGHALRRNILTREHQIRLPLRIGQ
ncbi:hypothetical protein D3C81_1848980 [compost metagenome]